MSTTLIGNKNKPTRWFVTQEMYIEDEDTGEEVSVAVEGEGIDECSLVGYAFTAPKSSSGTKVEVGYYYRKPNSEWWEYCYDIDIPSFYPVVFACDSDWKVTECLNSSIVEINVAGTPNGWKIKTINLKREIQKGENLYFGFYSEIYPYTWNDEKTIQGECTFAYFDSTSLYRKYKNDVTKILLSTELPSTMQFVSVDEKCCAYLEYENEIEATDYKISICDYSEINSSFYCRRLLQRIFCEYQEPEIKFSKRQFLIKRTNEKYIPDDFMKRKTQIKKTIQSGMEVFTRSWLSRLFFRTIVSTTSFWDWLKGKIREANNVVTFFCPIDFEIEMECKI